MSDSYDYMRMNMKRFTSSLALALVLWIGIPLPDSSEAQWTRSPERNADDLYTCDNGDSIPAYFGISASTIYCNGMQRAWELAGWLGLSVADAATIITRLPLNPDGTRNTSCPLAGDCDPQVADLSWDTACLNTALAILVSQQTGTATSIDIGPQTCLTGTDAATATITESGGADWSIVTAAAAENLTHAGSVTGSGSLTVTACVMASCAVSTAFPWSYVAPPTPDVDTTPPNPVTKVEVTAGVEEATVSWDQVSDPANGTDWSGISEYRIYCDGMLCDTIASPSSGPIIDLTERAIGSPMGDHSCTQDGAELTVVGGGAGQDGTADSYSGCYTPFTGAFIAAFEIGSLEDTAMSTYHKAVFDARASLDANSAAFSAGAMHTSSEFGSNAFTHSRPRTSVGASRATAFNQSVGTANEAIKPWYRIERRANGNFDVHDSDDGTVWTGRLDNHQIALPSTLEIGLAATATSDGVDVEAVFDSFSVSTGRLSTTVTGLDAGSITFTVRAVDADGNIGTALPGVAAVIDADAPPSPETAVKWDPGHGVAAGGVFHVGENFSAITSTITAVCNNSNIKYISVWPAWNVLESDTAGDYAAGFAFTDQVLAAADACGKKVMMRLRDRDFGAAYGGVPDETQHFPFTDFPAYLYSAAYGPCCGISNGDVLEYGGLVASNVGVSWAGSLRAIPKLWEGQIMDRVIALSDAYAARYDDDARFYMWSIGESSIDAPPSYAPGDAIVAQYNRAYTAGAEVWLHTMNRLMANYTRTRAQMVTLLDNCVSLPNCIVGGPDPACTWDAPNWSREPWSVETFRGEQGGTANYVGTYGWVGEEQVPTCSGQTQDIPEIINYYQTLQMSHMIWNYDLSWSTKAAAMASDSAVDTDCPANMAC